jgi:UDP-4-amino-4,6-dideoxy-N-acetyl-beta-L-altrosamine transaminase
MDFIPYGRQDITVDDVNAVRDVLNSDYLTQGPAVPAFEESVSQYVGAKYGVAVNSATAALHIACLALGCGPGDIVWTSPITFVASANCARYCGADVDFVDICPITYNMSVAALEQKLEVAKQTGKLPKVVIPVHLCGLSCDMARIRQLADIYGFRIIEDASHAIGGTYRDSKVGSCRYSDITVFSFHPVKIITTGEGGMAITNDDEIASTMQLFRSHGITRDPSKMYGIPDGPWYYQQIDLGYNYRMTDIQAALGTSQIRRVDSYISTRNQLADRYDALLACSKLVTPCRLSSVTSAFHLYVVRVVDDAKRDSLFAKLQAANIGVNVHYIPVHLQPYYKQLGYKLGDFPNAESYYSSALSLPLYPNLKEAEQDYVITTVLKALS